MYVLDEYDINGLEIKVVGELTDGVYHTPSLTVDLDPAPELGPQWKLLGGGGRVGDNINPRSATNSLLTAMAPLSAYNWTVRGKDHFIADEEWAEAFCVAGRLIPNADYSWTPKDSLVDAHPSALATPPPGFVLVGGGAIVHWEGAGSMLYQSKPEYVNPNIGWGWRASAKDHMESSPAKLTAYAIGLSQTFLNSYGVRVIYISGTSEVEASYSGASSYVDGERAWVVTGGAETTWRPGDAGSLLTGSFPGSVFRDGDPRRRRQWWAYSKDQQVESPSRATSWAIAIIPA